jgi:predicted metal-dependent HD superfamily phosphohydrolase
MAKTTEQAWQEMLDESRLSDPERQWFRTVVTAYQEPWRHYHNLQHIRDCLDLMDLVPPDVEHRPAIRAAVWFHDVVYDPKGKHNEAKSADVASAALCTMGAEVGLITATILLIWDTIHRDPPESEAGRYMVDIDLAILGASPERFDAYELAIRKEYGHVPDAAFCEGRMEVLRNLMDRESIYSTGVFRERFELAARENLRRSIQQLISKGSAM